ncbi:periplasmic heavy metal sensor [Aliifodinibius sp. S!AR15-10]|uniref:Spy/CpxP family protein refolding chaperone n=1 Tax=Aliifodinibius sp. S!AR15-10 TaxID=2950437 RepID=UPI0028608AD0|nr:periplasmic heavy metal sensor [Aliifodinibius sp. S!AR15-10]MDR8391517.1 periplasmic heavy metal sensor [Aliifodinibius sp. S!AR15-10]
MEYAKKYRWALTGFIILLILNIGTIATIWLIRPPREAVFFRDEPPRRVQQFLQRELELNPGQQERIRDLRIQHVRKIRPLMDQLRKRRTAYVGLLQSADSLKTEQNVDSLSAQIGQAQARIERINYEHFRQIRRQLREDQKPRFDRILEQSMRGMHQRRGPGAGNRFLGN